MHSGKEILGKAIYTATKLVSKILDVIIDIMESFVNIISTIANGFITIIGMGGCLLLFIFFGPFGIYFLLNPYVILIILFLFVLPLLGSKFISFLKYIKYVITEYFYDMANYFMYGKERKYKSFSEYGNRYRRQEEARRRKEEQERRKKQQREWEERFKQWYEYQNQQRNYGEHNQYGQYKQYNDRYSYGYNNPIIEFKSKYEEACDILGIPYNADKYQIKLAYRKKAKEYHPDLNKSENATEMFQKINNAYEFLNDDNISRYKNLK